jgi:hypothetical protein
LVYGHDGASVNEAMTPKRAEFTHWRAIAGHDEGSTVVQRTHDSTTVVAKLALGYLLSHLTFVALGATGPSRALGLATQTNSRSTRSAPHRRRRRRRSNEKTPMHRAQPSRQPMTRPLVQSSHACRSGFRVSKTSRPPGANAACTQRSIAPPFVDGQEDLSSRSWSPCPNRAVATRSDQTAENPLHRSAPGLARATSRDARAGSTPMTRTPRRAKMQANVPLPQPMSRTLRAENSSPKAA